MAPPPAADRSVPSGCKCGFAIGGCALHGAPHAWLLSVLFIASNNTGGCVVLPKQLHKYNSSKGLSTANFTGGETMCPPYRRGP